jgi:carbon-monoxide dehydrogenase medium subunit
LITGTLSADRIAEAAEASAMAASPIDDVRGGAGYRRNMVRVLVQRALEALRDGCERKGFPAAPPMLWGKSDGLFAPLTEVPLEHSSRTSLPIECTVNGQAASVHGAESRTLLEMLREDLGLTGSKEGCGEGECGACTVWLDGIAVLACLVPAPRAHGTSIMTVEGLASNDDLHRVQQAFIDEGAVQCGYCTPGFVMSGANLLEEIRHPTHDQIVAGLHGNLCRCTGYYKIVQAIEQAASCTKSHQ